MLVLARESRGLNQTELARAIGVKQAKVSKYENGFLNVSDDDLAKVSSVLGYHRDFFFQTDTVYGLGATVLFHRRRQTAPARVQRRVQAQVNILRMQIDRLLRSANVAAEFSFEPLDLDELDGDPEVAARCVRAAWRLPPGPIANMTTVIENAGGIVVNCDFGTNKIDAVHYWLPGLPPMFFMNAKVCGERHRFNLAHEVAHAILHKYAMGDVENEANSFGANFLMPREVIEPQLIGLTLQRALGLKRIWKVSMQAIIRRARDLGKISERKYRRLFTDLSARGYRRVEPDPIEREEPTVVKNLVDVHRSHLAYSPADLRRLLFADDTGILPVDRRILRPRILVLRDEAAG